MLLNKTVLLGRYADVYLDGVKLEACFEADDAEGYAWVGRQRESSKIAALFALPGDFVCSDVVVERKSGKIEFAFNVPGSEPLTLEQLIDDAKKRCVKLAIHQMVQ